MDPVEPPTMLSADCERRMTGLVRSHITGMSQARPTWRGRDSGPSSFAKPATKRDARAALKGVADETPSPPSGDDGTMWKHASDATALGGNAHVSVSDRRGTPEECANSIAQSSRPSISARARSASATARRRSNSEGATANWPG